MRRRLWVPILLATMACSASPSEDPAPAVEPPNDAGVAPVDAGAPDVAAPPDAGPPEVDMAAAILAKLGTCTAVSKTPFATDNSKTADIDVCGMKNAVYWQADMDIDCDGKQSAVCSKATDPSFQSQTATTDSKGDPLGRSCSSSIQYRSPTPQHDP